jgi:hypothetical protein
MMRLSIRVLGFPNCDSSCTQVSGVNVSKQRTTVANFFHFISWWVMMLGLNLP